jgi:hypothetical protein
LAALFGLDKRLNRKAEGRRQKAEGRRQKAEGRRQKAEGRRQKAEGRRQKAEEFPAAQDRLLVSKIANSLPFAVSRLPIADEYLFFLVT